jgi:EAL domain-containing protein (putative c-di-GMP-specific phosphodiesterase class I)
MTARIDGMAPPGGDDRGRPGRETLDLGETEAHDLRDASRSAVGATANWVLEARMGDDDVHRTLIQPLPFIIGRTPGLALVLPSTHVSKLHAQIYSDGLALRLRDLGSRNGTFLNHHPINDAPLHEGDVLGVGNYEFHLQPADKDLALAAETIPLTRHIAATRVRELIDKESVAIAFQPIVTFGTVETIAYEALGTGALPGLPQSPIELFDLAGALGPEAQAELSRLFRRKATQLLRSRPDPPLVFLNTHPADLEQPGLLRSLEALRAESPSVRLVLEVHESALADPDFIVHLHQQLRALDIGLAYDDFGAGQARLNELGEVPAHFVKFDMGLVHGIHEATERKQRVVRDLVRLVLDLGSVPLAEGVELEAEAAVCREMGFRLIQGYLTGRPRPIQDV